ncbi:MAG: hypothetical protein IPO88_21685 [Nannocystis sp.]|uniref:hypothetical protein n=1 Tax=Nannocystis sp. TaxID=1962667 RepID=UPI0024292075|nr:hypothetical protein [Nannocystis sp.]MBK9756067.1 hypothetical protein [Nannocystis sp.]
MSLRTFAAPVLLSLVAAAGLSGCAKRSATDSSIGAPEPMTGAPASGPAGTAAAGAATWTSPTRTGADEAMASRDVARYDGDASVSAAPVAPMQEKKSAGLGTSYGEQRFSSVRSVRFRRADMTHPDALLSLRYNDAEGVSQMAHWKTGQYPQRANFQSGALALTLRDDAGNALPGAQIGSDVYAVGEAGARYTIGVENHSAQRYEVVASVDGLDVIDGGEADFTKRGYLIDPYTSFVIEGWRTGDDTVAAFRFSDMDDSYAGRTGKARNIGVIGLAFFREEGQVPHDELRRRDQADPFPNRYAPPPPGYRANGY